MDARELTFGIEIETVAPQSAVDAGLSIGPYHCGRQVPYLPEGWKAEADSSITASSGYRCEIVSPVLRGVDGLAQVFSVLRTLGEKGHTVNASCGVHIHVGWDRTWSAVSLARLITIVAYLEKGLYAITGSKRRETGPYCSGIRKYGNDKDAKRRIDYQRYHALNLTNLARGTKDTVEFRVFSGSLSATKVAGWIQVCLGLVERAVNGKRSPSWTPKPLKGGWKKAGEGQSETERLLGYLAWGQGVAKIHGGHQFGWLADIVAQDEIKAEFRRLAKQYDAQI
jgi:hypothetical protein